MRISLLKLTQLQKIEVKLKRQANLKYCTRFCKQRRSKWGAYSPERRRWGHINTLCSYLKTCFEADIKPKYAKNQMRYFWKKAREEYIAIV